MLFRGVLFLTIGATLASARSASSAQNSIEDTPRSEPTSYLSELRSVYKIYQECSSSDLSSCLKLKLIAAMDRVARTYNEISLVDGVNFVKTSDSEPSPAISESELDATLPRATSEREDALNNLLVDKVSDFFETHTLQVSSLSNITERLADFTFTSYSSFFPSRLNYPRLPNCKDR